MNTLFEKIGRLKLIVSHVMYNISIGRIDKKWPVWELEYHLSKPVLPTFMKPLIRSLFNQSHPYLGALRQCLVRIQNLVDFIARERSLNIVDCWRDAVSPGSPPLASFEVDHLPCDTSLDFPFHAAFRGLRVPGVIKFNFAISIDPLGGLENQATIWRQTDNKKPRS